MSKIEKKMSFLIFFILFLLF